MSKIIKTKIDNVPVELEILNVGPASPDQLERLSVNLAQEATIKPSVRVVKVGTDQQPAKPEEVEKIKEQVKNTPADLVGDLVESLTTVPQGKNWWQSRVVWVNIVAIIATITATFGLPINIDPNLAMALFPVVLAVANLFLRGKTNKSLNPVMKKKA